MRDRSTGLSLKTGDQGSIPEAQAAIVKRVEQGSDFARHRSWQLPDDSTLKLYHRVQSSVEVQPIAEAQRVKLASVSVPEKVPPDAPVPVTYEWTGSLGAATIGFSTAYLAASTTTIFLAA